MTRRPRRLPPNPVPVFYEGGDAIAQFRSVSTFSSPEDWVGSVTKYPLPGGGFAGLSVIDSGDRLLDLIEDDPMHWLGRLDRASETGVLVKLLHAGERLPVHWHPDRAFACDRLSCAYGKSEGWVILSPPGGRVWLGFKSDPSGEQVQGWLETQDSTDMLGHMNQISVGRGDVIYVPPGIAHAVGAGVLLLEIQEPTSFSFLLEHSAYGVGRADAAIGIGWTAAYESLRWVPDLITQCVVNDGLTEHPESPFPAGVEEFFRVTLLKPGMPRAAIDSLTIGVVIEGHGFLRISGTKPVELMPGSTWVIPAAAQFVELEGSAIVVLCKPPKQLPKLPGGREK